MIETEDIPGRLLTEPNLRGRLRVTPTLDNKTGRTKALRVRVFTDNGLPFPKLDIRATEVEVTVVEFPDPKTGKLDKRPGSFWFYGSDGFTEVGFLPDRNAGSLAKPMAVEAPRKGREAARKVREAQG